MRNTSFDGKPNVASLIEPWDGLNPLHAKNVLDIGERCSLRNYVSRFRQIPPFKICVRPYRDIVSDSIRRRGRWSSCDGNAATFKRAGRRSAKGHDSQKETLDIFLEAGANIGACTLTLLAAGANVIAFEPSPSNLFYLTSSILANKDEFPDWADRLKLYPVALGAHNAESLIYESAGNAGNSAVSKPIGEDGNEIPQMSLLRHHGVTKPVRNIFNVSVRKLDDVIRGHEYLAQGRIRLMKLDVQGFETFVLRGASQLFRLRAVENVHYELASRFLRAQGSSAVELHTLIVASGFKVGLCDGIRTVNHSIGEVQTSDIEELPDDAQADCEAVLRI